MQKLFDHPLTWAFILALISAITNLLTRWETPADWEKAKIEHPRIAAIVSLLRALGIDPVKAMRALTSFFRGRWGGGPPAILAIAILLSACAQPTRAQIRSGILLTARGVVDANNLCASTVRVVGKTDPKSAVELAQKCTKISNFSFDTLEAGEKALDAADETKSLCAIASALGGLKYLVSAAKTFGDIPKSIEDALALGEFFSGIVAGKCEAK